MKNFNLKNNYLLFFILIGLFSTINGCKKDSDENDTSCQTFLECQNQTLWTGRTLQSGTTIINFRNSLTIPTIWYFYRSIDDCWGKIDYVGGDYNIEIIENTKNKLIVKINDTYTGGYMICTFSVSNEDLNYSVDYKTNPDDDIQNYTNVLTKSSQDINTLPICEYW